MLQYNNDEVTIQVLPMLFKELFKVGTCLNFCLLKLSLVLHMFPLNMLQCMKLIWKRKINRMFLKDEANQQKQLKLSAAVESNSHFF